MLLLVERDRLSFEAAQVGHFLREGRFMRGAG
jgi:hypothetical protein